MHCFCARSMGQMDGQTDTHQLYLMLPTLEISFQQVIICFCMAQSPMVCSVVSK